MNENLFLEIFRELFFDFLMIMGIDLAKTSFGKKPLSAAESKEAKLDSDILARRVLRGSDEARSELFAFILSLKEHDPIASRNLLRRQMERQDCAHKHYPFPDRERIKNERYELGDENKYVRLLTTLYVSLNGSGKTTTAERLNELSARRETFITLGRIPDDEFDKMLEFLNQDTLAEWIRKALKKIDSGSQYAKGSVHTLASGLRMFDAWLEKKGVR